MLRGNDSGKPAQPMESEVPTGSKHALWWSAGGRCVMLGVLFAVILAGVGWLTPLRPYATLYVGDNCRVVLFSPDSSMLVTAGKESSGRTAGPLRVWDVVGGYERFAVAPDWKAIETVLFSPDNGLLAAHEQEGDLKLWDTRTGDELASLRPETHFTNWVNFRFSPEGRYLVFQDYAKGWPDKDYITFWNIESRREQGSIQTYFWTLVFAANGKSFVTYQRKDHGNVSEVLLWTMEHAPVLLKEHSITAYLVAFSPDLQTFATADDLPDGSGEVALWDMATGHQRWRRTFDEHGTHLQSLSFAANGKVLSAHGGGGTQLNWRWRTTLWEVTSSPRELGSFSEQPAVSADGKWLAIPLDSGAKLLEVSSLEETGDFVINGDVGASFWGTYNNMKFYPNPSFSPDSKMLAIKGLYRQSQQPYLSKWVPPQYLPFRGDPGGSVVRVWDVAKGRELQAFNQCTEAHFSPDSRVVATLEDHRMVKLWKVPFRKPLVRVLGWSALIWMVVALISWLGIRMWKRRPATSVPRREESTSR